MLLIDPYLSYGCGPVECYTDISISPESCVLLKDSGVSNIDDAVEKLLEEIDYVDKRLNRIDECFEDTFQMQLEEPMTLDYGTRYSILRDDKKWITKKREALQNDLEMLLDRTVPF